MDFRHIAYSTADGVAHLTLNRPERRNAIDDALLAELREAFAQIRRDNTVRALLLDAAGKAFCVGAELNSMAGGDAQVEGRTLGNRIADSMSVLGNQVILDLRALPVPVVVAVNGAAAGAGVGLALAADIVVAARSAFFYLPFVPRLGIVPDLGSSWFLHHALGPARATGLTLLGDRLSAQDAERWGLIWCCVEDDALAAQALHVAQRLATLPAHAAIEARRIRDAAQHNGLAEQLAYEAARQRELIDDPAFAEGVKAFLEKREPSFPSRSGGN